jgi:hypothetical protein
MKSRPWLSVSSHQACELVTKLVTLLSKITNYSLVINIITTVIYIYLFLSIYRVLHDLKELIKNIKGSIFIIMFLIL